MIQRASSLFPIAVITICVAVLLSSAAFAQVVPGSADVGRIKPESKIAVPDRSRDSGLGIAGDLPQVPIPKGADAIRFTLRSVRIDGATAFTRAQLSDVYAASVGKEVTLATVYAMAAEITKRYHDAGYFFSRAFVPDQNIKNGTVILHVVEGYISKVELPEALTGHRVVRGYVDRLIAQKPVTSDAVESFLLRINDLPGYSIRAVLTPLKNGMEGATKLTLIATEKDGNGAVSFDNLSSKFLGPHELTASYSTSLLPLQQTSIVGLTSIPGNKLRYGTLEHRVMVAPDLTLEVDGGVTKAYPGYTLNSFDIESEAITAGASLNYQWVRQRQENLSLKLGLDGHNVTSDILGTPLTRDRIRAVRAGATYDVSDNWRGYNTANVTLSQGIDGLGASTKDNLNPSRGGAIPNFSKAEVALSRSQGITNDWALFTAALGQWSPDTLYSSEQFGYGGQALGRAYDASEITGDKGVAGSLELRYGGWGDLQPVALQPYGFYDIGAVWSEGVGQSPRESGASAGFGMRIATQWHQTGNLGVAWPLTRDVSAPIYGGSGQSPRLLLQIGQEF